MKPNKFIILFFFLTAFIYCKAQEKISQIDLENMYKNMLGAFSNSLQSKTDSSFAKIYFHSTPIWQNRKNEFWLYAEQANAETIDKTYSQQVYRLFKMNDSLAIMLVYNLPTPSRYTGAWKDNKIFEKLRNDSLKMQGGCAIFFTKNKLNVFTGRTHDIDCPSKINGAIFTTRNISISNQSILWWDQGFDANGKQVWGETKGGYLLIKQKSK